MNFSDSYPDASPEQLAEALIASPPALARLLYDVDRQLTQRLRDDLTFRALGAQLGEPGLDGAEAAQLIAFDQVLSR